MKSRIGTRVRRGMIQRVRVDYDARGRSTVTALGPWEPVVRMEPSVETPLGEQLDGHGDEVES